MKLKGEMLTEWADHVAGLVQPDAAATVLRSPCERLVEPPGANVVEMRR